ncbi:hypothetical protein ABE042_05075 [Viridibacillus arvi]|uniref:Resolvase HTH domain-containing protein n=1 Tax=Viridibacillus arvi TaxID=263475 RepID=A0A0M0LM36_9BACL|nr:hypothetical protein [Viridibacillus arvi]KOO52145.1 hypothetical protein AMD00_06985 [Viridibacillus arvi]
MELSSILMIVGIIVIIVSFFIKDHSTQIEGDVEELSLNFYQETHQLKRRLKVIEEELLLEPKLIGKPKKAASPVATSTKGIHQIIISQVQTLHKQGYTIPEISKRSSLSTEQVQEVLQNGGSRV